jgi:desulfoferrodoxin-like iron-binding protein
VSPTAAWRCGDPLVDHIPSAQTPNKVAPPLQAATVSLELILLSFFLMGNARHRPQKQKEDLMGALKDEIYKCEACGNVVLVLEGGAGDLVCCGENMKLLNSDEAKAFSERMAKPGSP